MTEQAQQPQQQPQQQPTIPIADPRAAQQVSDFNRFVAEMSDVLELLEHDFLGEEYDRTKNAWVKQAKSIMNKEGVHFYLGEIRARVNKNTFISDLSEDTIKHRVNDMLKVLNVAVFTYGERFNIEPEIAPSLNQRVGDIVEFALYRAKDAGERNYYGKSVYEVTHRRIDGSSGFFGNLPILGRIGRKEVI